MEPITIYPLHDGVINLLKDLEKINLLRFEKPEKPKMKLSDVLRGSISHDTAQEIRKQRQLWERDI